MAIKLPLENLSGMYSWYLLLANIIAQKMKFSIKDSFSKCDWIRSFLRIWSHLLEKYLMENFIFCAVCWFGSWIGVHLLVKLLWQESFWNYSWDNSQSAITCSKSTIETLQQWCEICWKLTIKTPKRRQWCRFGVLIVNFEHISQLCSSVSIVNFEHVIANFT